MTAEVIDYPEIEDKIDAYSRLVAIARDARKERDEKYWIMGQCAILLETHYRDETLARFANEIGVDPKRLYEYKVMTEFYPSDKRALLDGLDITYSHMREAKRLGTVSQAIEFLHDVAMSLWTIVQTRERVNIMLGKMPSISQDASAPAKIYTSPMLQNFHPAFEVIATVTEINGKMVLGDTPLPPEFESGQRFRVMFEPIDS